jgi:hypothetical protein
MATIKRNPFQSIRIISLKRTKLILLLLLLNISWAINSFAQVIPLVYDVENTGANYPKPVLPTLNDLPTVEPLTDPFEWSDGSGRSTNFSDWSHRRAEIGEEFQNYEIGDKPDRPDTITASYSGGVLTVNVTENGQTLTLTSQITLPSGTGPFPAVIGMNSGTGSLPASIFTSRNVATIPFMHNQVVVYGSRNESDAYYKLYPDLIWAGQYSAWAWGISRLIDGLELVQDVLPIDLSHLAVTGCSYAGKLALIAGALDERIALTIAQESGGGGAAAWRVSETLTGVETLGNTNFTWFRSDMSQFKATNVSKLPLDHHELMAMIAPRALLVLGNPDMVWLADESGFVSCQAAKKVWDTFGISDRFGFSYVGGHGHCALPTNQYPEVEAFVEKFLLGDTTANTLVMISPFNNVDYSRWTEWWGNGEPAFALRDRFGTESIWLEAECGTVGGNWDIMKYLVASNQYVVSLKSGLDSTLTAPTDSASSIYFPFTVTTDSTYYVFARIICPKAKGDSYWVKMDNGEFKRCDGLVTSGMQWKQLISEKLTKGGHTLTIAYNAVGAKLDKLCISNLNYFPGGEGEAAANLCTPVIPTSTNLIGANGFALEQNYPNPNNGKTSISFEIPENTYVSLKVFNLLGVEIAELAGKEFSKGKHTVEFESKGLSKGIYFYKIKAGNYTSNRKMIVQGK